MFLFKSKEKAESFKNFKTDHPTQDLHIDDDFGQHAEIKAQWEHENAERAREHAAALEAATRSANALKTANAELRKARVVAEDRASRLRAELNQAHSEGVNLNAELQNRVTLEGRLTAAETARDEWHRKADVAAQKPPFVQSWQPPAPQKLAIVPEHDVAGRLRGLLLKPN